VCRLDDDASAWAAGRAVAASAAEKSNVLTVRKYKFIA
jgi:hypothetical protein